jgi:crotonobetainyl-CoA:carnitine CoA-transferase CaiB-like acyl-CoA transferase
MPVYTVAEAMTDPHNVARGMPQALPVGEETVQQFAPVIKLSGTPGQVRHAGRLAGADNDDILTSLGYDPEHIAELKRSGAIRD